jgi:hypothetical protein
MLAREKWLHYFSVHILARVFATITCAMAATDATGSSATLSSVPSRLALAWARNRAFFCRLFSFLLSFRRLRASGFLCLDIVLFKLGLQDNTQNSP